ncbi:hypothetical protein F511_20385 [Dorcoceras hygrometricum]|uniref:Uncharacterized protein n=1 Tax=Dorcoceras hygrometricum TaxID=472368 RepID=A0A2Z7AMF6_9LAMI|nr:hypothetical protein F511_20385 [Dorcoceras hygrometricum]
MAGNNTPTESQNFSSNNSLSSEKENENEEEVPIDSLSRKFKSLFLSPRGINFGNPTCRAIQGSWEHESL